MVLKSLKRHLTGQNILLGLSLFLVAFIPLYPKIPLFSPIESYIVRVRFEDLIVLGTFVLWLGLLSKRKIKLVPQISLLVGLYIVVGGVSLLSAMYVLGTIPLLPIHIGKSMLHWARYIEYFTLLFICYSAISSKKHLKFFVVNFLGIISLASLYGIGQRYLQFPVYSTMNREYSKGVRLVLDSLYARVQSTFAGHYDFGAFLVLVLPIALAVGLISSDKRLKTLGWISYVLGLWGMVASASRSAFVGFFGAIGIICLIYAFYQTDWKSRWGHLLKSTVVSYGLLGMVMVVFGGNITQLFITTIEGIPTLNRPYQAIIAILPQAEKIDGAVVPQYTNPVPAEPTPEPNQRPADVYQDIPEKIEVITINEDGQPEVSYEERPRTFSECALKRELSLCIRLEALWPQALAGFEKNPLLGSGYATLNKNTKWHFTEADGTDNNYLRILGETGLLGFLTYFTIIGFVLYQAGGLVANSIRYSAKNLQSPEMIMVVGYIAGTAGLLVNALYIDVFAASKVAFTFWGYSGLVLAAVFLSKIPHKK